MPSKVIKELNETDKLLIRILIYTGGTLALGSILFFGGRAIYRKQRSKRAERDSIKDNTPENFAKRLKMAFDNDGFWGTNVENIREVFKQIPSYSSYVQVGREYTKLTEGKILERDLTSELTASEFSEMQAILSAKPQKTGQKVVFDIKQATALAKRLKAGFDYTILGLPATDKGAVRQALNDIPTQYAFSITNYVYFKLYGVYLTNALNSELDVFDFSWVEIITQKPKK